VKIFLRFFGVYSFMLISLLGINNVTFGAIKAGNKATIDITATVMPSCTIVPRDALLQITNFSKARSYSGATTISVVCTKGTKFAIGLNNGTSPGATVANRKMKNRTSYLNYSLYKDSGNTLVWGNNSTNSLTLVATGERQTFNVYLKIPTGQKSIPGRYLDSVNVSINLGGNVGMLSYQLSVPMNIILQNTETRGYNNL
jgi:spore coat protein U-like protein